MHERRGLPTPTLMLRVLALAAARKRNMIVSRRCFVAGSHGAAYRDNDELLCAGHAHTCSPTCDTLGEPSIAAISERLADDGVHVVMTFPSSPLFPARRSGMQPSIPSCTAERVMRGSRRSSAYAGMTRYWVQSVSVGAVVATPMHRQLELQQYASGHVRLPESLTAIVGRTVQAVAPTSM